MHADDPDPRHPRGGPSGLQGASRRGGQSLQEYLRAELIEGAKLRAPGEIAAEVEAEMSGEEAAGYAAVSATAFVRADRDAR